MGLSNPPLSDVAQSDGKVRKDRNRFKRSVVEEIHTDGADNELDHREDCAADAKSLGVFN